MIAPFSRQARAAQRATASAEAAPAGSVLVVGEALIDVVHRQDGSVDEHPGGSPANVAITLGRLERDVRLLTWIGEDAYGSVVRRWLGASGVTLAEGSTSAARTSLATATLDESGAASYSFEIEWRVPSTVTVDPGTLAIHAGSVAATLAPGGPDVVELLGRSQPSVTITYDPNVRPTLMGQPLTVAPRIEELVMLADVVKVSDEDLAWLYPHRAPETSAALWQKRQGGLVVMTRGGEGAIAWSPSGIVEVTAPPTTVADTVGAGDSFMGALIDGLWSAGLLGGHRRAALRAIDAQTLTSVLERCAKVAAITVSRPGANPPRLEELA